MKYHWAIINPEVYPHMFLKELDQLCREYEEQQSDDIKRGCKRNYCGVPASSFARFIQYRGFNKARRVYGTFTVDDPRPLSLDDFTDEEKKTAKIEGYDLSNIKQAWEFVQQQGLEEEMKKIPHYWTGIDKLIIDFTGHTQFVQSGMASDTNPKRYKKKIKESINEEIDSKELTTTIKNRILNNKERIKRANKPGEVVKIIRQIATTSALEIGKKYDKSMTKKKWSISVYLTPENQHFGETATNEKGYGMLKLFISKPFTDEYLEEMKSDSPGIVDGAFNHYWLGVLRFLTHELLHIEQWARSKGKQGSRKHMLKSPGDRPNVDEIANPEQFKYYLSDKLEISAYSMNAVQELQSVGMDINKLYHNHLIKNPDRNLWQYLINKSQALKFYWSFFGDSKDLKDRKVWNLFVKKFIYHLELRVKNENS